MLRKIFTAFLLSLVFAGSGFAQSSLSQAGAKGGFAFTVTATRPANTTTYSANDVVGGSPTAVLTLTSTGHVPVGGEIAITTAIQEVDITAIPSGMTSFRLHLYTVTPPSALADNAAWDLPSGDRAGYVGYIDLGSPADLGSTLFVQNHQMWFQLKLAAGSTTLYGYLVTTGGFAPAANSEVYKITLRAVVP